MTEDKKTGDYGHPVGIIVLFAILGAIGSFLVLNYNFKQHTELPDTLTIMVRDSPVVYRITRPAINGLKTTESDTTSLTKSIRKDRNIQINERSNYIFHYAPVFLVWTIFVMIMMAIGFGTFPAYFFLSLHMGRIYGVPAQLQLKTALITFVFAVAVGSVTPLMNGLYRPAHILRDFDILLNNSSMLIPLFAIIPIVSILPVFYYILLAGLAANTMTQKDQPVIYSAFELTKIQRGLKGAIQIVAAIVVLSLLCATSLRMSIKSVIQVEGFDILPNDVSLVYGLFFTLCLAVIYLPTHNYLRYKRQKLHDIYLEEKIKNPSGGSLPDFEDILPKEETNQLKPLLAVFSPLITSIIGAMPEIIKNIH